MALSDFIRTHHDVIIDDFVEFARTLMPPGAKMTHGELRDHSREILTAIVEDMATIQSDEEQDRKSRGMGTDRVMAASGLLHAEARIRHGFAPAALLAEFRALRASVLRLYQQSGEPPDLSGVRRFNESIDEALTESITRYGVATDRYRDQFVGVLGHDLRSPLQAITAGAALLAASDGDSRPGRVGAQILRSAHRMRRMIDDLLDLTVARLGGAMPLTRMQTDLAKVSREVTQEIQAAYPNVAVDLKCDGDLTGEWDPDRLAQVLSNLVGNAVHHGDRTTVTVTAHGQGDDVVLSVHNFGPPISATAQRVVFEPLMRERSSAVDQTQGIGLGLFIAKTIVLSHGGTIAVDSSEAAGTTFTVRLPRHTRAEA